MLKQSYPSALPAFSVDTNEEAVTLISLAGSLGFDNKRYGIPHILRSDEISDSPGRDHLQALSAAFDRVEAHLVEWDSRLSPNRLPPEPRPSYTARQCEGFTKAGSRCRNKTLNATVGCRFHSAQIAQSA